MAVMASASIPPVAKVIQHLDAIKWLVAAATSLVLAGFGAAQYLGNFQTRDQAQRSFGDLEHRVDTSLQNQERQRADYDRLALQAVRSEIMLRNLQDLVESMKLPPRDPQHALIEARISRRKDLLRDTDRLRIIAAQVVPSNAIPE